MQGKRNSSYDLVDALKNKKQKDDPSSSKVGLEEPEVNRLLLPKSRWNPRQKVNLYSKVEVISKIKEKLSAKQLDMFKNGCFGHLLDMQINRFPSQLMHHLVLRQCLNGNEDELCFNIEGNILNFGLKDFALMTGLNCDNLPTIDKKKLQEGSIKELFFPNQRKVQRKMLNVIFDAKFDGSDDEIVKLANLYCLESLIIPKQEKINLDLDHMKMLDNDELFHSYPWGKKSYELTIDFMKKGLNNQEADAYGIGGFPYALIAWAYETIPTFHALGYVGKIEKFLGPRVLHWTSNMQPNWRHLNEHVFGNKDLEVKRIVLTKAKMEHTLTAPFVVEKKEIASRNNGGLELPKEVLEGERFAGLEDFEVSNQSIRTATLEEVNNQVKTLLVKTNQLEKMIEKTNKTIMAIHKQVVGVKLGAGTGSEIVPFGEGVVSEHGNTHIHGLGKCPDS